MVNPFDHDFFKFFIGFVCILTLSFGLLYIVNTFSGPIDAAATALSHP